MATALAGCASEPVRPAADRAALVGHVRLVPRDGVPTASSAGAYGDRRLAGVRLVDYSKPGFAIVYIDANDAPGGRAVVAVESGVGGPRFSPALAAVGVGGRIVVENGTGGAVVVSMPGVDRVESIAPGGATDLRVEAPGPVEIFLLGTREAATVWASPGPWTRVDAAGGFVFPDLEPGRVTVRAWHPRFPTASHDVELRAGEAVRLDFEIGVGRGEASHGAH